MTNIWSKMFSIVNDTKTYQLLKSVIKHWGKTWFQNQSSWSVLFPTPYWILFKRDNMPNTPLFYCTVLEANKLWWSLTTIPVEGLRSSSMMKRYLRARKVARVDGINMQGYIVGEKSACHPLGKMLSKSSSFSEFSCGRTKRRQHYVTSLLSLHTCRVLYT